MRQIKLRAKQKFLLLHVHKFNIDVTDNDVHQSKEVLPTRIYLADYRCYAVLK